MTGIQVENPEPRWKRFPDAFRSKWKEVIMVLVIVAFGYWYLRAPTPVVVAPKEQIIAGTGTTYGAEATELTQRQRELIALGNKTAAARTEAAGDGTANVSSVLTSAVVTAEEPKPQPAAPTQPDQKNLAREQRDNRKSLDQARAELEKARRARAQALLAYWNAPSAAAAYSAVEVVSETSNTAADTEFLPILPLATPLRAQLTVGANSDAPGTVVAILTDTEYKLIGQARRSEGGDTIRITFTQLIGPQGSASVTANAYDPKRLTPALRGSVNYHVLANLTSGITQIPFSYLAGYSSGVRGGTSVFGLSPIDSLRSEVGSTLSDAVPQKRQPTVTYSAGQEVLVVIESIGTAKAGSNSQSVQVRDPTVPNMVQN